MNSNENLPGNSESSSSNTSSGKSSGDLHHLRHDWRWLTGGSVVGLAVVIGCASAIDFRGSGREAGSAFQHTERFEKHHTHHLFEKDKPFTRRLAAEAGDEPMHNNGKIRMPISVTVEGDMEIVISRDTNLIFSITAESEVTRLQGYVQGGEGLESFPGVQIDVPALAAGETHMMELTVPAKSGSLYFRLVGDFSEKTMSGAYEIKVVNPKEVKAASKRNTPTDMNEAPTQDSSGMLVQPMKASE